MAPDDLAGEVSEEPFGAGVEPHHPPVAVEDEEGEVRAVSQEREGRVEWGQDPGGHEVDGECNV